VILRNDCNGRNQKLDECAKHLQSTRTFGSSQDKWLLLPVFLKANGLVKQHIDSFNHFVDHDLKNLLNTNNCVTSDVDPKCFLVYTNIYVGKTTMVALGTGPSHRRMQAEVHDVICTGGRRYRVSAGDQAHQTAASYAGPLTDHAREQQVHAQW